MKQLRLFLLQKNNEKGVTLIMVMMVMVVLSILGLSILGIAINNMNFNVVERDYQAAYYIAEAGITKQYSEMEAKVSEHYNSPAASVFFTKLESAVLGPVSFDDFEASFGEHPIANVKVERKGIENNGDSYTYIITSEGVIGKRARTVTREVKVNWHSNQEADWQFPTDMAIFTNRTIDLNGNIEIDGNIGTNSSEAEIINIKGNVFFKEGHYIFVPPGSENTAVTDFEKIKDTISDIKTRDQMKLLLPPFPDFPIVSNGFPYETVQNTNEYWLNLEENIALDQLVVPDNHTLVIDVGNANRAIVTNSVELSNSHITIAGSGSLTVYVRDNVTMTGKSTINQNGNQEKIIIYLKGTANETEGKNIKLTSDQQITGSVYAEDANVDFSGTGGFKGYLLTGGKNVKITGGVWSETLIFAPRAHVELGGGGTVKGAMLSDSFSAVGTAKAVIDQTVFQNIPFITPINEGSPLERIEKSPVTEKVNK